MKVLFVFRDGVEADYLYKQITSKINNKVKTYLIKETGKIAKRKKIERILNSKPFYFIPIKLLDLLSVQLFNRFYGVREKTSVYTPIHYFDDINEPRCIESIKALSPKIVIIFGTGIVSSQSIGKIGCPIFNIHTGVLPKYRNVYSEFWAIYTKDYKNVGCSLIKIDPGIDTGQVFKISKVKLAHNLSYSKIKKANLENAANLVLELVDVVAVNRKPKLLDQNDRSSKSYPTPRFLDLVRYLWFSARK